MAGDNKLKQKGLTMAEDNLDSASQPGTMESPEKAFENEVNMTIARIHKHRVKLRKWIEDEDIDILTIIYGITSKGWPAQVRISTQLLAKIMLDCEYCAFGELRSDVPQKMLDELIQETGLSAVTSISFERFY